MFLLSWGLLACDKDWVNRGRLSGHYDCRVYREAHYVFGIDSSWDERDTFRESVYFYRIDSAHNKTDMVFESSMSRWVVRVNPDLSFYAIDAPGNFTGFHIHPDSVYAEERIGSYYVLQYAGRK